MTERGDEGVERIKELTNGIGADSVLECFGTQESMVQAIESTRRGVTWATSASRTESTSTENSSFMLTFIFTVAPRPCAASCPS